MSTLTFSENIKRLILGIAFLIFRNIRGYIALSHISRFFIVFRISDIIKNYCNSKLNNSILYTHNIRNGAFCVLLNYRIFFANLFIYALENFTDFLFCRRKLIFLLRHRCRSTSDYFLTLITLI